VDYLDFEVEVSPAAAGEYSVRVLRSPAGEASGTMRFPFDTLALENRLQALQIALLRSGGTRRRIDLPETKTVRQFGAELWQALFTDDVLSRFEVSRNEARTQNAGLRLKLRFTAPELAALPWEYLYDASRGDYLSLSLATPLVRYIALPEAMEPLTVDPPLRILGLVVSPDDLAPLDVEREKQRLEYAVAQLRARELVELQWLPGRTWRDLRQALRRGPWHVFHFIGHGGFDELHGEGVVILADDDGNSHRLSATDLGRLLGDHESLRLAVLNSCESARGDRADVFSSTAAVLVRRGTPAVVAMQYEITDNAAIEFSRSFYEAIADGLPVDTAVSEARKGIAVAISDTLEWGTPVLFMRAPDGVLFRVSARPESLAGGEVETSRGELTDGLAGHEVTDVTPRPAQEAWTNGFGASDVTPSRVGLRPTEGGAPISLGARFQGTSVVRRLPLAVGGGLLAVGVIVIGALAVWIRPPRDATPTPTSLPTPSDQTGATSPQTSSPTLSPTPSSTPSVEDWAHTAADEMKRNGTYDIGSPYGVTLALPGGWRYQAFVNGVIYQNPHGVAIPIYGWIYGKWNCLLANEDGTDCAIGGPGPDADLGYPKDREGVLDVRPQQVYQLFDKGGIYCNDVCGFAVFGPVHDKFEFLRPKIGLPTKDVVSSDQLGVGGYLGRFDKGFIFSDSGGVHIVACTYEGLPIEPSATLTDCLDLAEAVDRIPEGPVRSPGASPPA
jgi:hypothetical protein